MTTNLLKLSVVVFSITLVLTGCAAVRPAKPVSDNAYPTVPYSKIVNPAFVDDYGNQWVHFEAKFMGIVDNVRLLPTDYQDGNWVQFSLTDGTKMSIYQVINKRESDILFNLQTLDRVDVFAYLVKGRTGILIEACKIKK